MTTAEFMAAQRCTVTECQGVITREGRGYCDAHLISWQDNTIVVYVCRIAELTQQLEHCLEHSVQAFARQGGLKGGRARADALTPEARQAQARHAANTRWAKREKGGKPGRGGS
jgi:hypothetical protein